MVRDYDNYGSVENARVSLGRDFPRIAGTYVCSREAEFNGDTFLLHTIQLDEPVGDNIFYDLRGNYQVDKNFAAMTAGDAFLADWKALRELDGGKTVNDIQFRFPPDVAERVKAKLGKGQ